MSRLGGEERKAEIERLVGAARQGDEEAFRQLLDLHRTALVTTLFACGVRCPETAQDLAQDVALRAWTSLGRLANDGSFSSWIRRIAANAARDHLRRLQVRREEALERAFDLAAEDDPHDDLERVREVRLMLAALEDEDEETVSLLMARARGAAVDELAEQVGVSPAALKMRVMRVRKRLRKRLERLKLDDFGESG